MTLERIAQLEAICRQLVDALNWYIEEDDTIEGDEPTSFGETWNEINAPWIAGKRRAEAVVDAAEAILNPPPSLLNQALAGDPVAARRFLYEAGIVDEEGNLCPQYQPLEECDE